MRVVEPSILAPTQFSTVDRYRSKSCMNPSVSRINHHRRFSRSIAFVLGLVEGGELVTMRATEKVQGAFQHSTCGPINQPAARDVEGLWTRYSREPGSIFPEVRRWGKEGLFEQPNGPIRQIWLPEG